MKNIISAFNKESESVTPKGLESHIELKVPDDSQEDEDKFITHPFQASSPLSSPTSTPSSKVSS